MIDNVADIKTQFRAWLSLRNRIYSREEVDEAVSDVIAENPIRWEKKDGHYHPMEEE